MQSKTSTVINRELKFRVVLKKYVLSLTDPKFKVTFFQKCRVTVNMK